MANEAADHPFDGGHTGPSVTCNALVLDADGAGTTCDRSHAEHAPSKPTRGHQLAVPGYAYFTGEGTYLVGDRWNDSIVDLSVIERVNAPSEAAVRG